MDVVEHSEMVEKELDSFIERRAKSNPEPDEREESYMESVRRYNSRRRHETLWARLRWHESMMEAHTRTFQEILDRHKAGVSRWKGFSRQDLSNQVEARTSIILGANLLRHA